MGMRAALHGRPPLRPLQEQAAAAIFDGRRHLLVDAPTGSGKSLIAHLFLLEAALRGQRGVLVEPLRLLARQQTERLAELVAPLGLEVERYAGGTGPLGDSPLVVATPERLLGRLRQGPLDLGAVAVDEAHLLEDPRRGPVLEELVAAVLPARVALISATLGDPAPLARWLHPATILATAERAAPLHLEVVDLAGTDPDAFLEGAVAAALANPGHRVLVFAYRRDTVEALAARLGGLPLHAGTDREAARRALDDGSTRCVVATTAAALGLDLPVSHVWVRDPVFHGVGRLPPRRLLQMLGRAGHGTRPGWGAVLAREGAADLRRRLAAPLPALGSALVARPDAWVLGRLPATRAELARAAAGTLDPAGLDAAVDGALARLTDPDTRLAWARDGVWHPTALGEHAHRVGAEPRLAGGLGALVRVLVDEDALAALVDGDLLVLAGLLGGQASGRWGRAAEAQVRDATGLLRPWVGPRAEELLGTLGLEQTGDAARRALVRARPTPHALRQVAGLLHGRAFAAHVWDAPRSRRQQVDRELAALRARCWRLAAHVG